MNTNEGLPSIEQGNERFPTREDILAQIRSRCEGVEIHQELSDADGLYFLETRKQGEKPNEFTEYTYVRKGNFPNGLRTADTAIVVCHCVDDVAQFADVVAKYDSETGEWTAL